jgi:uncharacterized membrane protein
MLNASVFVELFPTTGSEGRRSVRFGLFLSCQLTVLMEEYIPIAVQYLATGIELLGAVVILYSSCVAMLSYFKSVFTNSQGGIVPKAEVRLALGRSLAIALELLLGADILKTAIAPTWNEIGQLAAIAAIRTALNYFLERELKSSV